MRNTLYYGDNLPIMREHIPDGTVDLVYLDPPFNSARDYNVLFKQAKKDENQAQITAFTDTWLWSKRRYDEFFDDEHNARLFPLMNSLHDILGASEMMAYLLMMAPRLLDLHRVLKPTGSLFLHCDPTASHYLKLVLDVICTPRSFLNELVWKRTSAHSDVGQGAIHVGRIHDIILWYRRGNSTVRNPIYAQYTEEYIRQVYRHKDKNGRLYQTQPLHAKQPGGDTRYEWKDQLPPPGRYWAFSKANMERLEAEGRIVYSKTGVPRYKIYLDESPGKPVQDLWDDIPPVHTSPGERLGYPTQKPLALLERIISLASNPGGLVLDPFCGCGTAVVAAEKLGRQWIGIDVTYIALDLMISRLAKDFGLKRGVDYDVIGDPKDAYSAHKLFEESPKQFEIWAVGLVAGVPQPEKSGDKGVDGKVYFMDLEGKLQWAVCQVKGGHLKMDDIHAFAHVIEVQKAAMGFFICLDTPTKGMYDRADELGFFDSPSGRKIPKLQIRTIKELLEGKEFDFPKGYSLKSGGGKRLVRDGEQGSLGL